VCQREALYCVVMSYLNKEEEYAYGEAGAQSTAYALEYTQ
jgi:hypothetical protein